MWGHISADNYDEKLNEARRLMARWIELRHLRALPQPPTPRESHGSRDRRAVESMRVAARFRRSV